MGTELKLGLALGLLLAVFAGGLYLGGLRSKAALETFEAAQAKNTATAVLAERASAATELARVNAIVARYENEALTPLPDPSTAVRVLERACPAERAVPKTGTDTPGTGNASPQPGGDSEAARLLQGLIDACARDASQLNALIAAWPR
jgi:hypothetical protein